MYDMLNVPGIRFLLYMYVGTLFCFLSRRGHVVLRTTRRTRVRQKNVLRLQSSLLS